MTMIDKRTERTWIFGAAALGLLLAVLGWFMLISPQRAETSSVQSETADAQTQNLTLQTRVNQLMADSKNRSKFAAALTRAQQALPGTSNTSVLLLDLQHMASASAVRISALTVGAPTPLTPPVATTPTSPSAGASSATPSGQASDSTQGANPSAGTYAIALDASVSGSPRQLDRFLERLQAVETRALLVTDVTRNTDDQGTSQLQLKFKAFLAPSTPAAATPSPGG